MKAEHKLRANWSKAEEDLMIHWPSGTNTHADANWLSSVLSPEFLAELKRRGYDPTTLKLQVSPQKGNTRFTSERKPDL